VIRESISFAKLRDDSWGVRVASHHQPGVGAEVIVHKRDGGSSRVVLGPVVDRDVHAFPAPAVYHRIAGRS